MRQLLIREVNFDRERKPRLAGDFLLLPVTSGIEGAERAWFETRDPLPDLPRHELIGGIAVMLERDPAAAENLLSLRPSLHTVLLPLSDVEGEYRTRRFEVLAGKPVTKTLCLEYGHRFEIDPNVGFDSRTSSSMSMNSSSFIIAPTGTTFRVWTAGIEYDQSVTMSVPIANDNTLHFVFFTTAGEMSVGTAAWDISGESAPCAMVYRTGTKYAIFDERHGADRNRDWHEWAHDTIGCRYESGLGGTFADSTFSFDVGALHDEDIDVSIDTQTVGKISYRNVGGATNTFTSTSVPYILSGDGNPQFDSAGTVTSVTTNQYFNSWFYGTNEQEHPIFIVAGQNTYNTLSGARNEGLPTIQVTQREWKLLYRATYRNTGGSGDYIEAVDYRESSPGAYLLQYRFSSNYCLVIPQPGIARQRAGAPGRADLLVRVKAIY